MGAGPVMTLRSNDRDFMAGPCRIPSLPPEPAACMERSPERCEERERRRNVDKLDGLKTRKRDWQSMAGCMEDYLQLPDDYDTRESAPGKKRVRWADLEEKKDADRKRAIGFIVGQTDWEKITDKSGHLAERALNRTKYI
ncbi:unnamed protein product [Ranitomeya imitator]|uniref:YLP motif-containing protein 1 n=1 Tax=Ranitomeya imitator TaxID=111125 RepID=A0ABN9LS84_9NEOB|nr:unnamed protein product [Ranitomeya imitator]